MHEITNSTLQIKIASKGAELQSVYNKETHIEYLWNADPKFWAKKSPVLFPIVGSLKNNSYQYKEKTYRLSRHGFARDREFQVTDQSPESITFFFFSTEETLGIYPFYFHFSVRYSVSFNKLIVEYSVENKGDEIMFFSVGAHPAFKVPLTEQTTFEDYYLQFNEIEKSGRWPLTSEGLIEKDPVKLLNNTNKLALQKSLFYEDALVFKSLKSNLISIKNEKTPYGISVYFKDFPYMGIWSAKDADFICIEPWCGIADSVYSTGELSEKEGINALQSHSIFKRTWKAEFF